MTKPATVVFEAGDGDFGFDGVGDEALVVGGVGVLLCGAFAGQSAYVIEVFWPAGCALVLDQRCQAEKGGLYYFGLILNENSLAGGPCVIKAHAVNRGQQVDSIRRPAELDDGARFLEFGGGGDAWDITTPEFPECVEKSLGVCGVCGKKEINVAGESRIAVEYDSLAADDNVSDRVPGKQSDEGQGVCREMSGVYPSFFFRCHSRMSGFGPGKMRSLICLATRIRSLGDMAACWDASQASACLKLRDL